MPLKEMVREAKGAAANLALRLPISWVNILTGPPVTVDGLSVAEARAEIDAFMPVLAGGAAPVGEILDRTVDTTAGRLRVRLYRPAGSVARLLPTILYFHGGGWTIGSLEAYDLPCRFFCARTGCALIAIDYRLAPEHKFPAGLDDAVAAFRWLASEGAEFGVDPDRIVVAGDSA